MMRMRLARNSPQFIRECAVDVAAVLGFRSVSMEFPVLCLDAGAVATGAVASEDDLIFVLGDEKKPSLAWSITRHGGVVDLAMHDAEAVQGLLSALLEHFSEIETRKDFAYDSGASDESDNLDHSDKIHGGPELPLPQPPTPPRPEPQPRPPVPSLPQPRSRTSSPGCMESGYHPVAAERGLESLFEREFLVKDEDFDFLPDHIDATIELPVDFDDNELCAACDLAARLGMESLGLELPILKCGEEAPRHTNVLRIVRSRDSAGPAVSLTSDQGRRVITFKGHGKALATMVTALCRTLPGTGDDSPLAEIRDGLLRTCGQNGGMESKVDLANGDPVNVDASNVDLAPHENFVEIKGARIELPWELDECHALLEREVYPRIAPGPGTEIVVVISEDHEVRRALEGEIRSACATHGAENPEVRVICAFKQGFSWLRDYELPLLASLGTVASIDIGFSAFLPEGRPTWSEEDGTTPRIAPDRPDDPCAWLDPPIRLLQELYPIDDILATGLGIKRDRITFNLRNETTSLRKETTSAPGYTLVARDKKGAIVYESEYTPTFSERPYLDDFPGLGKVHPGTGLVRLLKEGKSVWETRFKTDMEAVWDTYQSEVLPAAREVAQAEIVQSEVAQSAGAQPFFSRLVVEVEASEPDEVLPCRHDRLSSLESLHEDLYFAGLDFFQVLGIKTRGAGYDSPGLILPVIRKRSGSPELRYSILAEHLAFAEEAATEEPAARKSATEEPATEANSVKAVSEAPQLSVFVDELVFDKASGLFSPRFSLRIKGDAAKDGPAKGGPDDAAVWASCKASIQAYAQRLSSGQARLSNTGNRGMGLKSVRFALSGSGEDTVIEVALPHPQAFTDELDIYDLEFPKDTLIDPDGFEPIAEKLAKTRGIRLRLLARSREGRPIWGVELLPRLRGYVSRTKLIATRPTLYVNARHHANEVSSTNSALMLIEKLLSDPYYARLSERLNVVIVPLENVDGAAIHAYLAHDNPEWMLHAARYDSLGGEFARDYFNDVTVHTEALAFTRVWRDWLPDVVADDHGVPSHEWCQQFSGYTSPWFKGFWMPRALLYGYFWYVTDEAYAANKLVAERIEDAVADAMGANAEFASLNAEWRDRFEKYAHAWMPKLFPAEYYKDVIFYWVPYPYKPDYYYVAVRFPWVTAVSFVSEVADETATGDYLALCARAHLDEDLAIIRLLSEAEIQMDELVWMEEDAVCARRVRKRPLKLPPR